MEMVGKQEIKIYKNKIVELEKLVAKYSAEVELCKVGLYETRAQLVRQDKLASLGALAAGIAHEIKNPINFVNNFSELSLEYMEEITPLLDRFEQNENTQEITELLNDVTGNLKKIHQNGTRVDGILRSMLMHSRGGKGVLEPTNLNELIREYVNLAFHGMRAGKKAINVKIDLRLDDSLENIELNPEEISRVILNLCNNAFDAIREKAQKLGDNEYNPVLTVSTTKEGKEHVKIAIEDNGSGVSNAIKNKLFQPFFTTKKGREGTGLGLSITSDIIKNHQGEINVLSKENKFTRFEIKLPLKIKKIET